MTFLKSWLVLIFLIPLLSLHAETIVIIKAVSNTDSTFVLHLGRQDGISVGQESLFSTENTSLKAMAIEVGRDFSYWKLNDPMATVPFHPEQFVFYSNASDSIYKELAVLEGKTKTFEPASKPFWIARMAISQGLTESISEVDNAIASSRSGFQIELLYGNKLLDNFYYALGLRMDNEKAIINNPALEIPTTRFFGTAELTYHFPKFENSKNHFYATAGIGYGISKSVVDQDPGQGIAWALPIARFGFLKNYNNFNYLFELVFEGITMKETYSDGRNQTTSITNAKISFGVKI